MNYGTCQDPRYPTSPPTSSPTSNPTNPTATPLLDISPLGEVFRTDVFVAKTSSYGFTYIIYVAGCSLFLYLVGALHLLRFLEKADGAQKLYDNQLNDRPQFRASGCSYVKELFEVGVWSVPYKDRFGKVPFYLSSNKTTDFYTCLCHNHPYISCAFFGANRVSLAFEQSVSLLLTAVSVASVLIGTSYYLSIAINLCVVPALAPSFAALAYVLYSTDFAPLVLVMMLAVISVACYCSYGDNHYGVLFDYLTTTALVSIFTELLNIYLKCVSNGFFRVTLFPGLRGFALDKCNREIASVLTDRLIIISIGHRFIEKCLWTGKSFETVVMDKSVRLWLLDIELFYEAPTSDNAIELEGVKIESIIAEYNQ